MRSRIQIPNHRNHVIDRVPDSVRRAEKHLIRTCPAFYSKIAHYRNTHDPLWREKIVGIPEGMERVVYDFVNVCQYKPIRKITAKIGADNFSVRFIGKKQFDVTR